jgi:crotonobetainyl-CoA:carnitine CoA-transferase CaiB-like acyl-CoA transferase
LFDAARTQRGRRVDVSMCEGALGFGVPVYGDLAAAGEVPARGTDLLTGGAACYAVYRTKDDRFLSVAPLEPKFWEAFNRAIGRASDPSELIAPPARQRELCDEVQAILATKTRDEWAAIFAGVDGCCEPVLSPAEAARHPVHTERGGFVEIEGAHYPNTALHRLGARVSHTPPPRQGEHTEQILIEAGWSAEEISALRASRATR